LSLLSSRAYETPALVTTKPVDKSLLSRDLMRIRTQGSAIDFGTRLHVNVVQIRASIGVLLTKSITILKSDLRCTSSLENVRKTFSSEVWCSKLKVMSCYDKELNPIVKLATDDAFHAMHIEKVVSCELTIKW
jgi:hypothetical protein